ncbi:Alpha/Beta hydrolase protein [Gloeopeniophorella convolvens]|nr:Alpha/Beta hydrolase protein [Gloeopeniophorella convolvens]
MLGVDPHASAVFTPFSREVFWSMVNAGDTLRNLDDYVAVLFARVVRVLLYVGANDFTCDWPLHPWNLKGKRAGMMRSAQGLTFLTIDGAGHMAPYSKPVEVLSLMQR